MMDAYPPPSITPEMFASIKRNAPLGGTGHLLVAEIERENAANFKGVAWECDTRFDSGRPTPWPCREPIVALVADETGEVRQAWCAAHLPADVSPERVIWRLS